MDGVEIEADRHNRIVQSMPQSHKGRASNNGRIEVCMLHLVLNVQICYEPVQSEIPVMSCQ